MSDYIEKQWREITSRNPISGDDFKNGIKDFKFSVGQGYALIPNQSYFRVELELKTNGAAAIADADNPDELVFADGVCGNLFNNIYFNMGGQPISSITNSPGQVEMVKNRTKSSSVYNDSIGKVQGFQAHRKKRQLELYTGGAADVANNSQYTATRSAKKMFIWQPALGIFDSSVPLGAGEYDIQLNPSQDYQTAGVDSGNAIVAETYIKDKTAGLRHFELVVNNIRFYACLVRANIPSSGTERFQLMEMAVQSTNVAKNTTAINEEVNLPSSTRAVSLFLQDATAGKHTAIPPSKFHVTGPVALPISACQLQSYQIQYANITKPTVMYDSKYSATENTLQQRYINTALETGGFFNDSGFETYEEWLERGPLIHETFIKAADNLATRAQVQLNYSAGVSEASRLFVVAHHSTVVEVTRSNGMITNVIVTAA